MLRALRRLAWMLSGCLAAPAGGQVFVAPASRQPAAMDLNAGMPCPLMYGSARLQQFLAASEIGTSTLVVHRVQLRYDGPLLAAIPRPHQIQQLTLRLGVTARAVDQLGADFAANLTQPLSPVLDHVPWWFDTDGRAQAAPEAFGGPNGTLTFALPGPLLLSVPAGGALALELVVDGNSNAGVGDMAVLDFQDEAASAFGSGAAVSGGMGCPIGPGLPAARLLSQGVYAPGTSLSLFGDAYFPGAPVLTLVSALPIAGVILPGTQPPCWFHLDLATGGPLLLNAADAAGTIAAGAPGSLIAVPRDPAVCGAVLFAQNLSVTLPWTGNTLGLITSNYRGIAIGCTTAPTLRAWFAANGDSATASVASFTAPGSLALRID